MSIIKYKHTEFKKISLNIKNNNNDEIGCFKFIIHRKKIAAHFSAKILTHEMNYLSALNFLNV